MNRRGLILLTGAAGAIGPSLARRLSQEGHRVRALVHRAAPVGLLPESVEILQGDICDRELARHAVDGIDSVFHLAARLHNNNPPPELLPEYERVNVEGTSVLLDAAMGSGVGRIVLFSTISVYGPTGAAPVDETSTPRPDTIYAQTKLKSEDLVRSSGIGVVLRLAAVYGPNMKGNYVSLVDALNRGRFVRIGSGSNLRTLVYSEDAVSAALIASRHPRSMGKIYNVTDGEVHTVSEITLAICEALGRRPPRVSVPATVARIGASMVDTALVASRREPRLRAAVDKYLETVAVSGERIQNELGFVPAHNLRRGWKETIQTWKEKPKGPSSVDV